MTNLPKKSLLVFLGALSILIFACTPKTSSTITKTKDAATEKITQVKEVQKPKIETPTIGATAPIPIDPSVRIGTLENGLKYYIKKNSKPENLAELRVAVRAGSMQEDDDQLGLAHFVEHMAFNGSEHFAKNELVDYLESVGTRFGADLNAYTSFDETVYMLQAKTDDPEKLSKALLILEDWSGGVSFDDEEIDKEKGVVISEWRTRLSASQRMQKVYFPIMYKNSRYATRLPIGSPEIIENAPHETVKRFY
ncbi:MAG TPA: insulinase family protein, partial [Bacteroidetes bacterium]|nr:insulinase family protein [Bacteroidota bacterium]